MSSIRSIALRVFFSALVISVIALMITRTGKSQDNKRERQTVRPVEATPYAEKNSRQTVESSHMPEPNSRGANRESLLDQVRKSGEDVGMLSYPMPAEVPGHPSDPPGSLMTKESDLVVVGTVTEKHSLLTDHQTDVFTEHQIVVGEVLKNDAVYPVEPGSTIYFARTGGSISFEGHLISHMYRGGVKPIEKGANYLLFLKRFPDLSDSYQGRAFLVEDGGLKACDGLKEFDENFPLSEARKNILVAAKTGGAR
ncbi:MAG: hypothetical protein ACREDR_33340 [Blastocatellia bacterium]